MSCQPAGNCGRIWCVSVCRGFAGQYIDGQYSFGLSLSLFNVQLKTSSDVEDCNMMRRFGLGAVGRALPLCRIDHSVNILRRFVMTRWERRFHATERQKDLYARIEQLLLARSLKIA